MPACQYFNIKSILNASSLKIPVKQVNHSLHSSLHQVTVQTLLKGRILARLMIPDLLRQQPNTTKIVTLQSKANAAISSAFACAALPSKCTLMLEADFSRVEDDCS